jgi:hypothetical protein
MNYIGQSSNSAKSVKSINIKNMFGLPLNITTNHKSGEIRTINSYEEHIKVEKYKTITYGSWTPIDPITKIKIEANGEVYEGTFSEDGVSEVENYNVALIDNKLSVTS